MFSRVRGMDHIGFAVADVWAAARLLREVFAAVVVYDTVADA